MEASVAGLIWSNTADIKWLNKCACISQKCLHLSHKIWMFSQTCCSESLGNCCPHYRTNVQWATKPSRTPFKVMERASNQLWYKALKFKPLQEGSLTTKTNLLMWERAMWKSLFLSSWGPPQHWRYSSCFPTCYSSLNFHVQEGKGYIRSRSVPGSTVVWIRLVFLLLSP